MSQTIENEIPFVEIRWQPPFDLGGGQITKYEIKMNMTSLETGLPYNPWSQIFDAGKDPRIYKIQIPSFTRVRIWVREGGGDTPIWGPYTEMKEVSSPQGGNKENVS